MQMPVGLLFCGHRDGDLCKGDNIPQGSVGVSRSGVQSEADLAQSPSSYRRHRAGHFPSLCLYFFVSKTKELA